MNAPQPDRHPADLYEATVHRIVTLIDEVADTQWDASVAACPGWTVGDVLRHVAGLASDVVAGRVDGYAGELWTSEQVASRAADSWREIRAEWLDVLPAMVAINRDLAGSPLPDQISHVMGPVPKTSFEQAFLVDLTHHEFDLRSALSRPRAADLPGDRTVLSAQVATLRGMFHVAGLPTVAIDPLDVDRDWRIGRGEPVAWLRASMFDALRSVGGRRTLAQMSAAAWEGAVTPEIVNAMVVPFFSAPAEPVE